jgi:hypothetical protein
LTLTGVADKAETANLKVYKNLMVSLMPLSHDLAVSLTALIQKSVLPLSHY